VSWLGRATDVVTGTANATLGDGEMGVGEQPDSAAPMSVTATHRRSGSDLRRCSRVLLEHDSNVLFGTH
jgi:hypothetical protein